MSNSTRNRYIRRKKEKDRAHHEAAARLDDLICPQCDCEIDRVCDYTRHLNRKDHKFGSHVMTNFDPTPFPKRMSRPIESDLMRFEYESNGELAGTLRTEAFSI